MLGALAGKTKLPRVPMLRFTIAAEVAVTGPPLMTASKLPLGQPRPCGGSGQVLQRALPLGGQSDQLPAPPLHVDTVWPAAIFASISKVAISTKRKSCLL